MFDVKSLTAPRIGILVTSIVILGACSHKQIKQEAQEAEMPAPVEDASTSVPTPEPENFNASATPTSYDDGLGGGSDYHLPPTTSQASAASGSGKQASQLGKKHKRKTRVAHSQKKSKRARKSAAYRQEPKQQLQESQAAAVGQVNDGFPGAGPGPGFDAQAPAPEIAPPPPPPAQPDVQALSEAEEDSGFLSGLFSSWATWLALLSAGGLGYVGYRYRLHRDSRRRLVFNA